MAHQHTVWYGILIAVLVIAVIMLLWRAFGAEVGSQGVQGNWNLLQKRWVIDNFIRNAVTCPNAQNNEALWACLVNSLGCRYAYADVEAAIHGRAGARITREELSSAVRDAVRTCGVAHCPVTEAVAGAAVAAGSDAVGAGAGAALMAGIPEPVSRPSASGVRSSIPSSPIAGSMAAQPWL